MLIFDGDYPMAYGAVDLDRDLAVSIAEARATPDRDPATRSPNRGIMATLPEMRRGLVCGALVKVVGRIRRPGSPLWGWRTEDGAYAAAQSNLAYYRSLARRGEVRLLQTRKDFAGHVAEWAAADAAGSDTTHLPVGLVIGMEGADPIVGPEQVADWWADGLRVVSLTHYGASRYAHGTGTQGGLTPEARPLLDAFARVGMILDLTHLADESFWQALDLFDGPVIASHQNCRALVPGERQFSDEQVRAVIDRDGVLGVAMDSWMLHAKVRFDWANPAAADRRSQFARSEVTLAHVADHVDRICQLAGDADHAAIGGDTDGQGGADGAPADVETVADYQRLAGILADRGYDTPAIARILSGNWARFYSRWLPAGLE